MQLEFKPDFEQARQRWDAFWRGEVIDRPCLNIVAPKEGVEPSPRPGQLAGLQMGYREAAEAFEAYAATQVFMAEAIPHFRPGFGPDQFAGFLGAELEFSRDSGDTNWPIPFVENWEDCMPLEIKEDNPTWLAVQEFHRIAYEVSQGKFLISQMDIHSNMDALLAIRGSERLCMDLIERPEMIDRAMRQVRPFFAYAYDRIFELGHMDEWGSLGWTPFYSRGKFATTQCDFICMISPEMGRRFAIPALVEEAAHLDNCVYHFDGPEALPHLDSICGIEDIDVIQWVQGAGNGSHVDWIDLLQDIQSRGKGLQVNGTPDQVKVLHRELRPEKVLYIVGGVKSEKEGADLIRWFERNT